MEATPLKAPFAQLLTEFLDPITPDAVALGVQRAASDENMRAQELAPLLLTDPGYRQYLFAQTFLSERMSEWLLENKDRGNRDEILLGRVLGLLGKTPVRNLVACARIERLLGSTLSLGPEDKVTVTPSQVIPFALEAEKSCEDNSWIGPENAFAAGLHYDWLAALLKKRNGAPEEKTALAACFKEGLLNAKIAYELGQRIEDIELGSFLFAAGLLMPIGKVLMTCFFPKGGGGKSWAELPKYCEIAGERAPDLAQLLEPQWFGTTHAELGSLLVGFSTLLRNLEKAIYFYPDPERLVRVDRDLYQLSSVLSVTARLALARDKKPRLEPFHAVWARKNDIDGAPLKAAVAAALKAK